MTHITPFHLYESSSEHGYTAAISLPKGERKFSVVGESPRWCVLSRDADKSLWLLNLESGENPFPLLDYFYVDAEGEEPPYPGEELLRAPYETYSTIAYNRGDYGRGLRGYLDLIGGRKSVGLVEIDETLAEEILKMMVGASMERDEMNSIALSLIGAYPQIIDNN